MLTLKDITKKYITGDTTVNALNGINIEFRNNEFVSILGQSGCGKTTLLNIIGGLDHYTDGDLIIKGKSTKLFKDRDWDNYRNHSVGFVFQSYNLIPHQSVLSNVELALTLTGVSKSERKKRAIEALEKVGLADQIHKKPNQMSGGQMQRVAIARALVNNPEILLADEPTGALDSETSIQIMDILKEISADKLVIMVTHNPELAANYSTRTVKLLDGKIIDDSDPYSSQDDKEITDKKLKRPSMSFLTALSLSLNNLMTKKTRTFLTSFAGSIGIIGIALILALSSGVDAYIAKVEEDTLSSYPITIEESGMDVSGLITTMMGENKNKGDHDKDKIYSNDVMTNMMTTMVNGMSKNNLEDFKQYIENDSSNIKDYVTDIQYSYSTQMNIYTPSGYQVNPSKVFESMGMSNTSQSDSKGPAMQNPYSNAEVWKQLIDNDELISKQYDLLAGKMPENYNELVVIVDENNEISDYTLYALGLKNSDELEDMMKKATAGEKLEKSEQTSYTYDDILNLNFKLLPNSEFFQKDASGKWTDKTDDEIYVTSRLTDAIDVKVVGILRASSDSAAYSSSGNVGYRKDLMTELINRVNDSEIVNQQINNPDIDVISGLPFEHSKDITTMDELVSYINTLPKEDQAQYNAYIQQMRISGVNDEEIVAKFAEAVKKTSSDSTYDDNLKKLGVSNLNKPTTISIYPKDFEAKESITSIIEDYNKNKDDNNRLTYTDYIGLMLSSVTTIINAISYILIAFVSISLIVSSIMIGIITYISVLERTKEIGILRAMGASKRDISRVFNAETLIVGLVAGAIGILITLLLLIPINAIIKAMTDISGLAVLPLYGAIILILISMILTFIAGLIPSRIAAKKDPVTALRSE